MLPSAVAPATLSLHPLNSIAGSHSILAAPLPFSVHTSKFRSLQPLFFLTLTDPPGVGSARHQTLPKREPGVGLNLDILIPVFVHPKSDSRKRQMRSTQINHHPNFFG